MPETEIKSKFQCICIFTYIFIITAIIIDFLGTKPMLLSSFSLYTNGKHLFSIERRGSVIGCLDGLRFFSICWIIFGHTYYMEIAGVKLNFSQITTVTLIKFFYFVFPYYMFAFFSRIKQVLKIEKFCIGFVDA